MKKLIVFLIAVMFVFAPLAYAGPHFGSKGPAPNSGDCIPDGSGFGEDVLILESLGIGLSFGPGPAPLSGDGIPDGSGFDTPPKGIK